jgi:hypothetical protein
MLCTSVVTCCPCPGGAAPEQGQCAPLLACIALDGLAAHPYQEDSGWEFADFVFSWNYDFFADGSKARRFGFHQVFGVFEDFRRRKVIP